MSQQQQEESFIIKYKKELGIGLIAVLMLLFIVWNAKPVEFSLVFFTIQISKIFLIALFFVLGMITVWIRFRASNKEKDKRIKELEEKLKKAESGSSTVA